MLNDDFSMNFPVTSKLTYFAHGRAGPICTAAVSEITNYTIKMSTEGSRFQATLPDEMINHKRTIAQLLTCSSDEIAFFSNTSECMARVLLSMAWQPGENIVASSIEFPGLLFLIDSLKTHGVEVKLVEFSDDKNDVASFINAIDEKTKLVIASHVNFKTGKRLDVESLCEKCRRLGVLTAIDFVQSLGALKVDLSQVLCDFGLFVGRKWMLSCDGVGVLTIRKALLKTTDYPLKGNRSYEESSKQSSLALRHDATRLELGGQPVLAVSAFAASARYFLETGLEKIEADVITLAKEIKLMAKDRGFSVLNADCDNSEVSGLVALNFDYEAEVLNIHSQLRKMNIEVGAVGNHLLIGGHFYNTLSSAERVISAIGQLKG